MTDMFEESSSWLSKNIFLCLLRVFVISWKQGEAAAHELILAAIDNHRSRNQIRDGTVA